MFFLSQWYDIDRFTDTVETFVDDQPRILQSAQFVTGIVQELMASDGIPPEKIVIGGFSQGGAVAEPSDDCLLYTSPSPRDQRGSRMPSSA